MSYICIKKKLLAVDIIRVMMTFDYCLEIEVEIEETGNNKYTIHLMQTNSINTKAARDVSYQSLILTMPEENMHEGTSSVVFRLITGGNGTKILHKVIHLRVG